MTRRGLLRGELAPQRVVVVEGQLASVDGRGAQLVDQRVQQQQVAGGRLAAHLRQLRRDRLVRARVARQQPPDGVGPSTGRRASMVAGRVFGRRARVGSASSLDRSARPRPRRRRPPPGPARPSAPRPPRPSRGAGVPPRRPPPRPPPGCVPWPPRGPPRAAGPPARPPAAARASAPAARAGSVRSCRTRGASRWPSRTAARPRPAPRRSRRDRSPRAPPCDRSRSWRSASRAAASVSRPASTSRRRIVAQPLQAQLDRRALATRGRARRIGVRGQGSRARRRPRREPWDAPDGPSRHRTVLPGTADRATPA